MVQNVTVFEEGVFKEVIKFKWDQDGLIQYDRCLMRRGDEDTGRHKRENRLKIQGSRWPSISSRERPQKKPNLSTRCSWTSSLQNCKKINFHCLSLPGCSVCHGSPSRLIQGAGAQACLRETRWLKSAGARGAHAGALTATSLCLVLG